MAVSKVVDLLVFIISNVIITNTHAQLSKFRTVVFSETGGTKLQKYKFLRKVAFREKHKKKRHIKSLYIIWLFMIRSTDNMCPEQDFVIMEII